MTVRYFPVDDLSRDQCEKATVSSEYYDKFFEVCRQHKKCRYVLKMIIYNDDSWQITNQSDKSLEYLKTCWNNEVQIYQTLQNHKTSSSYQFVPNIYDWWFSEPGADRNVYFFILMEKYDGNLVDFVKLFTGEDTQNNQFVQWLIKKEINSAFNDLKQILNTFHYDSKGINLENILYKAHYDTRKFQFVYIDFAFTDKTQQFSESLEIEIDDFMANFPYLLSKE
jgi:hypothetical protein